jgi:23S rRNA (cytidine1920-2'-O)/16S rRNA (cytidine1409-2'-O)-methyltransferase
MRLDLFLFENGYAKSRTEAKNLIVSGSVKISGKPVTKPSFEIEDGEGLEIRKDASKYVSRGGYKLEGALLAFDVNPEGKLCIDIGA